MSGGYFGELIDMRYFSRSALVAVLIAAIAAAGLGMSAGPAAAATPNPDLQETARLLGYMWGDGSRTNGVWDVNGPSGTSSVIEELVVAHGGTWVDRQRLTFTLPAPYNWADWKDGLPDNSQWVRDAVENPNFLAAVVETEASVFGQIYDQSSCCVDGFTRGRLTELRDLMRRQGYSTAQLTQFGNVDSGRVSIDASEFAELRSALKFACPTTQDAIRVPGGTDLASYGNLRWIQAGQRWGDVARDDCPIGAAVTAPGSQSGSCTAVADGNRVTVDWTFTRGDAVIRRDGKYITTVSALDGAWSQDRGNGQYSYEVRSIAFGVKSTVNCGTVTVPGNGTPPAGPCVVQANGNNVTVSWDNFGKDRYSIRRNGSWAATVDGGVQTAVLAGSTADSWELRYFDAGTRVDVPCTGGAPVNDGPCRVTANGNGVRVEWDAVAGISDYQVRKNGSWRATVTNATRFDDPSGSTADTYSIRYRRNGARTDISCA